MLAVGGSTESQVSVVTLDGQIDARAIDQVGNQDIFQHIQIVFNRVETNDHQFGDVAAQSRQEPFGFSQWTVRWLVIRSWQ